MMNAHRRVSIIGGGLPSLFHAQLCVQLPPAQPTSADVLEWTRVEGAWLGVGGGGQKKTGQEGATGLDRSAEAAAARICWVIRGEIILVAEQRFISFV